MPYNKPELSSAHLLIVTVGLPRSGKSTWAKQQRIPIVNQDAIRLAIHGQRWLKETEELVKTMALYMVKSLFLAGHHQVILDETCVTRKRRDFWSRGRPWQTVFKYVSTPEAVCLLRAADDPDIQPVIRSMARDLEPLGSAEEIYVEPNYEQREVGIDLAAGKSETVKVIVEKTNTENHE